MLIWYLKHKSIIFNQTRYVLKTIDYNVNQKNVINPLRLKVYLIIMQYIYW